MVILYYAFSTSTFFKQMEWKGESLALGCMFERWCRDHSFWTHILSMHDQHNSQKGTQSDVWPYTDRDWGMKYRERVRF
jgi:hypothetical protein